MKEKKRIPKQTNLKLRHFLFLIGILGTLSSCLNETKSDNEPNVILILVDDLGYGDISFYGQQTLKTPNIDKMANEGMHFTNMYTGSTVCAPSRACLLTGKHTGHCSVRGNDLDQMVSNSELTLAKVFKNAGYKTGAIGKWGIGGNLPHDDPAKKGYEYFYGYINMWHAHNFYPEYLFENGEKIQLKNKTQLINGVNPWLDPLREGKGVAEVKNEYAPFLFDSKAISFIEKNKDDKFFLYLAYNVPHANNEKSPDGMEVPDYYEFSQKNWPSQEKGFAAMIRNIDNSVGLILKKLVDMGIDKNTLVLFCSDNGPHQEGGHQMDFFNSNGSFRGMKRDLYQGGVKTPFIAYWPGVIPENSKSDDLFAFWDFLPTFSELTDREKPADTDGISFLPALFGQKQTEKHDYLYWEFYEQGGKQAILKDQWKAIKLNIRDTAKETIFELYNIKNDPEELVDVADQNIEVVRQFEKLFESSRNEFEIIPLINAKN
ncbi:sulfatase-like hydrolase/transferase [Maribellus comscasis]|uniref:Sulfatase-like hydrolase/transferase n=1 Tax=Maribellus comscasis TaxID=2681766 RepID=A0A6I6JZA0_9BACT|nr:arylsulfatase [Maribellus comscasis]QGY46498.1 sulfatase-like hydrolase/transferase [Maribellus comscasis]